eukprot:gb/GEZN01003034.1/.p1 GENE.gb/GEZN01003034.1/~~gb/GEZN01003034.1/.p1  ORF type:complete len:558 (-),score=76.52 gb/GEZN01003034.1/:518-2191(-)
MSAKSEVVQADWENEGMVVGNYRIGEVVGRGRTARVMQGRNITTGEVVALKALLKRSPADGRPSYARNELTALARCKSVEPHHPHLIQVKDAFQTKRHIWIVEEFQPGRELYKEIQLARGEREWGGLNRQQALDYFVKLVSAVLFLHEHKIAHRDLKPSNILVGSAGELKIVDFGLALCVAEDSMDVLVDSHCGSPHYIAPEVCRAGAFDPFQADIWSLGVILFAMVCGFQPFDGTTVRGTMESIVAGQYPMPDAIDDDIQDLIGRLLVADPSRRMPLREIQNHRALQGVNCVVYPPVNHLPAEPPSSMPVSSYVAVSSSASSSSSLSASAQPSRREAERATRRAGLVKGVEHLHHAVLASTTSNSSGSSPAQRSAADRRGGRESTSGRSPKYSTGSSTRSGSSSRPAEKSASGSGSSTARPLSGPHDAGSSSNSDYLAGFAKIETMSSEMTSAHSSGQSSDANARLWLADPSDSGCDGGEEDSSESGSQETEEGREGLNEDPQEVVGQTSTRQGKQTKLAANQGKQQKKKVKVKTKTKATKRGQATDQKMLDTGVG